MGHMKQQQLKTIIFLILIVLALAACGGAAAAPAAPTDTPPPPTPLPTPEISEEELAIERGQDIFMNGGADDLYRPEYACSYCHSLDDNEIVREYPAPSLQGIAERAGGRVPGLSAEEYIRQSIADPPAYITEGYKNVMSRAAAFLLTDEEIDDLVAFLLTQ